MFSGLEKIRQTLRKVDCVIEVHDARIPLSGRNPLLKQALSAKPRVIVLNKVDMIQVSGIFKLLKLFKNRLHKIISFQISIV